MPTAALINKGSIQDFYSQGGTPANPPSGQARTFYDGTLWHAIDSTGADVTAVSASGLPSSGTWNAGTLTISGNPTFSGFLLETPQNNITAAGNSQGTATAITTANAIVTTTASGTGVVLPTAIAGMLVTVTNNGANTLLVYPASGAQIDSLSANSSGAIPAAQTVGYYATDSTHWVSIANGAQAGNSITVTHQLGGMNIIAFSSTPTLGTPVSGTLTNCTGLPAASVVAGALANGMTATKQTNLSNDTKVATDSYADTYGTGQACVGVVGFKDDFQNYGLGTVTTITEFRSDTTWEACQIAAAGTQTPSTPASQAFSNPGQITWTTSGTSGQGIALFKGGATGTGAACYGVLGANGGWEIHFILKLAATTLVAIRFGITVAGQALADPPTAGMYYEYDTANTGNTDSKFTGVTRSGSASTYTTTNQVAADTNFHHFRIRSTVAGTIGFTVDGGTEDTTTQHVDSSSFCLPFFQLITRTSAGKAATIDMISYAATTGRT